MTHTDSTVPRPNPRARRPGAPTTALAAAFLVSLAAAGCDRGTASETASALGTATVERVTIVSSVDATGTVEPIRIIDIKSQASGAILELPVELGDHVERGALLVRIDPRDVRNAHEQARADLEVAEARFEVSQRQLERTRSLRGSAVVTEEELETAMLDFANARAALVKARTNLELTENQLNDVTLRAPLAGTIVERSVEEGTIVSSTRDVTGGTSLMRMADLSEVQVRTLVDETDIGRVMAGLPARITVEAFPERTFNGSVLKIEPQAIVEQNVTMFAVLARIPNPQGLLRPGMNADVEIVIGREENALALPNGAVKTPEEARQLARALGIDPPTPAGGARPGSAGRSPGSPDGRADGGAEEASREAPEEASREAADPDDAALARLQSMSAEERRRHIENLSPAERQSLLTQFRELREQEARRDRANPARPRPAFVFVTDARGGLTLKPVTIGLGSWEHIQILDGLEEGDRVVEVPLALVQQRELLERIRSRSGVPGVQRN